MSTVSSPATHGHASMGPSSASRWMACPASVERSRGVPSRTSPAAERGTRCHALAEMALRFYFYGEDVTPSWRAWDQEYPTASDKGELAAVADEYVSVVREVASRYDDAQVLVEHRVKVPGTRGHVWGTADAIVWSPSAGHLHVLDLKSGGGVRVTAKGNPQGRLYALGALSEVDPDVLRARQVTIHIVQPARDGHTEDTVPVAALVHWGGRVAAAVDEALAPAPRVVPGEAQCRWCPARAMCEERIQYRSTQYFGEDGLPPKPPSRDVSRDGEAMGKYLAQAVAAREFAAAVDEAVKAALAAGTEVPGWRVARSKRRKITDPAGLAERLASLGVPVTHEAVRPLRDIERDVGPSLGLLAGDTITETETTRYQVYRGSQTS